LMAGGTFGLLGLLGSAFSIGSKGWSFAWMNASFGELASNQFGMGWGAVVVLVALVVLMAFGAARRGYFKGDLFIAAAVFGCAALLALFILFPVLKALSAAFFAQPMTVRVALRPSRCGRALRASAISD
jgi:iron(III) transport system permease protein